MNNKELDQQILDLHEEVLRKEKIDIHTAGVEGLIQHKEEELSELEIILNRSHEEILSLDKTNIRSLFKKLLGNLEQDVEREKQEYLLAILKVDNCRAALKSLKQELGIMKSVQSGLFGVEKKLEILLRQKDLRISQDNPEVGKKIMSLDRQILSHKAKLKELEEAIAAGKVSIELLKSIVDDLEHVIGWGTFDYHGKGTYSTYKKKQFIDKASHDVLRADALLIKFEEELHDVSTHYQLDYESDLDYYQHFLDTFLNNLITDYIVQKKIKNSLHGVEATMDRIEMTIITLQSEIKKTQVFQQEAREVKRKLLLDSIN